METKRVRGPFLERPETFRAHFEWHSSLCIFRTKASRSTKLYSYFNFPSLCNIWKDQLYRISGLEFYEWLFEPKKFSGLSRKGPKKSQSTHSSKSFSIFNRIFHFFFFCEKRQLGWSCRNTRCSTFFYILFSSLQHTKDIGCRFLFILKIWTRKKSFYKGEDAVWTSIASYLSCS